MENTGMNLFERMSEIEMEIAAVAKNLRVGEGRSSYKAVGEADVLAAVKPVEAKWRVYSYPAARKVLRDEIFEKETTYKGEVKKSQVYFIRIETTYRFVNIDNPSEFIDITTYGDGIDSQDKSSGKAMTYSDKYALLKAYKVMTGDDPDQDYNEKPEDRIIPEEPQIPANQDYIVCPKCLKPMKDAKTKDGRIIKAIDIFNEYGMCIKCHKEATANDPNAS